MPWLKGDMWCHPGGELLGLMSISIYEFVNTCLNFIFFFFFFFFGFLFWFNDTFCLSSSYDRHD